jgi:hypothetical protein
MDPEDAGLTPDSRAELIWARAEAEGIRDETSGAITCGACGREFTVPRGRGWRSRRYCDQCREDGNADRVRRARQGVLYRKAADIIEEHSGTGDP